MARPFYRKPSKYITTKQVHIDLGDILFHNKELDDYLADNYDDMPDILATYKYEYLPYRHSTYDSPAEGGYNVLEDVDINFTEILKYIPMKYHREFVSTVEDYAYKNFDNLVEYDEDYLEPNPDDAYENWKDRQFENVNEGSVNFRKRGRDLYDEIDNRLSRLGDVYLVRFYCDDDYLVVSTLRGQKRDKIDEILEEYGFFSYDIGASNERCLITYKKDDRAFECLSESYLDDETEELEFLLKHLQRRGIRTAHMTETQGGLPRIAIDTDEYYDNSAYEIANSFVDGKRMYVSTDTYPATTYIRLNRF